MYYLKLEDYVALINPIKHRDKILVLLTVF